MKKFTQILALVMILTLVLCSCSSTPKFSQGLDENGYFEGVTALDYIEIEDIDAVEFDSSKIESFKKLLTETYFPDSVQVTDRAVNSTDDVNIDYVGTIDGEEFEGGSTEGNGTDVNIATTSYIDGFLSQLVGHMPGENFDINVTFPDDYSTEELAGKDAVFNITINYITETTPAEWGDDFVSNNAYYIYYYILGTYVTTAEDCINAYKSNLISDYMYNACTLKEDTEIPESVQTWINESVIRSIQEYAEKQQGVELITYLKSQYECDSKEEFLEEYAEDLEDEALGALKLQALSEKLGITVTEDQVKEMFDDEDEDTITYEEALKTYGSPYLRQYLLEDTLLEHFTSITTFN